MYGDLASWRAYAAARGDNAPTAADDADATAALVRASDYIRFRYVANLLPGYDTTLQPTGYDYPLVDEATYIAASYELATPGFFSKTYTEADRKVLTEVKGIKWTVTGKGEGIYANSPTATLIEAMFDPYIEDDSPPYFGFKSVGPKYVC